MATTAAVSRSLASVLLLLAVSINGVWSKSFTVTNNCGYTVWPGVMPGAGSPALDSTGFQLAPGQSQTLSAPAGWSGKLWGRTLCSTDTTGTFTCVTGDCGSGRPDCAGGNAAPPATLAEFTLDGSGAMDFYDVSLVDGYNLPVLVAPQGAAPGGNCAPTGCLVDLNSACPADLKVTSAAAPDGAVACKSAVKSSSPNWDAPGDLPLINGTMTYTGSDQAGASTAVVPPSRLLPLGAVFLVLAGAFS
nr:unnamed protein product [Digitaria exilis]